jgi:hypothetical protein
LYNHWLRRQQKKLPPFVVLNAGPLHHGLVGKSEKGKGKRKFEYHEVSSDEHSDTNTKKRRGEVESDNEGNDIRPLKFGPPPAGSSRLSNSRSKGANNAGGNATKVRDCKTFRS